MSIEQLLLLVIFVIIPLIQSLFARLSKRRSGEADPENESEFEELLARRDQKPLPPYMPPRPAPPRLPKTEPAPVIVRPRAAPAADPVPTRPSAEPLRPPALGVKGRGRSRYLRELLPRDLRGLRRAILLAEVLGPPRCLDRSDPFSR